MTGTDLYGLDVSLSSASNIASWNSAMQAFLAHGAATPEYLGQVLKADPDFALALACKGMFSLLLGRKELVSVAYDAWQQADTIVSQGGANTREATYVQALKVWLDGHPDRAAIMLDDLTRSFAGDALALKLVHAIRFILGDAEGMRQSLERVIGHYNGDHPASGYMRGCYAFALEETGDYEKAEAIGRSGLELAPNDAWGFHAVAHVFEMQAETQKGIEWLSGSAEAWEHCNNFRYHVWWHLALFYLANGDHEKVLSLYDEEIRREQTDDYRDISNAASLLMRLEIEGVSVGSRWEELATISEGRVGDECVVFADLHYLLSLMGGDRETAIANLLNRMRGTSNTLRTDAGCMDRVTADPGFAAASGLEEFRVGHYSAAFSHLKKARPTMKSIGGSNAQRDVFEWVTVESALRAGLWHDARLILEDRAQRRGGLDSFTQSRLRLVDELIKPTGLRIDEDRAGRSPNDKKIAFG